MKKNINQLSINFNNQFWNKNKIIIKLIVKREKKI